MKKYSTSTIDTHELVYEQPKAKRTTDEPHLKVDQTDLVRGRSADGKIIKTPAKRFAVSDENGTPVGESHYSDIRKAKPLDIQKPQVATSAVPCSGGQDCQLNYQRFSKTSNDSEEAVLLVGPGAQVPLATGETRSYEGYTKSNYFPGAPGSAVVVPNCECDHTPVLEQPKSYHRSALLGVLAISQEYQRRGWAACLTVANVGLLGNASQGHPHCQAVPLGADSAALAHAGFRPYEVANARLKECRAREIKVGRFEGIVAVDPLTGDPVLVMPKVKSADLGGAELDSLADFIVVINGYLRSKGVGNCNIIYKNPPFNGNGNCFGVRWCIREKWGAYQAAGLELATSPFAFRLISTDPFEVAKKLKAYLRRCRKVASSTVKSAAFRTCKAQRK